MTQDKGTHCTDNPGGVQSVTISIPAVIDRDITPNGRAGWRKKYRLQQELKSTTMWAVKAAGHALYPFPPWELHVIVVWPKGRKVHDDDNIRAGLKYLIDGIAEECGVDDKYITVRSVTQTHTDDRAGHIKVAIEPARDVDTSGMAPFVVGEDAG